MLPFRSNLVQSCTATRGRALYTPTSFPLMHMAYEFVRSKRTTRQGASSKLNHGVHGKGPSCLLVSVSIAY